jgi:NAD(P)-dependent dehydrogenase (short-subunit alcohol dehydrogenase family)
VIRGRRAIRAAGEVDVLVGNAGETVRAPLETVPLAEVERLTTLAALRAPAEKSLRARKEAPENEPFLVAEIDW